MTLSRLKELDYEYSYKLATIFGEDSKIRLFFIIATQTGTFFAWALGLIISLILLPEFRSETLSLSFIFGIMLIPVFIIKHVVRRNRPTYKDDRFGTVAFDKFSFPSGHATRAAYTMILMPFYTPNLWLFWIFWGLVMIISRLILGVHYISDIITGIIVGSFCILIIIGLGWVPVVPFLQYII